MTLIDSKIFEPIAIALGTALFLVIISWTVWYGSRLK
jgi:hypothetical protein